MQAAAQESEAPGTAGMPAAKAAALVPWLRAQEEEVEAGRRLTDAVAARLAEADLFRITQPPRFGGLGLPPAAAWEAIFQVARGCASSAWVAGLGAANVLMLGKFSAQAQADVFLCGRPAIVPMLTGGVGRDIVAEPVPGGVTLSGRWRYASGIDVASWVGLLVPLPGSAAPEPHVVLVPADAFAVDPDSWHVLGMRGTGSRDIVLPPTFVPAHRWTSWPLLLSGAKHPDCPNDEPVYDHPLNPVFAMSVAAPVLGLAAAVAETFRDSIAGRVSAGTKRPAREEANAQAQLAAGTATMDILTRSLLADAAELQAAIATGRPPGLTARGGLRMRSAIACRLALAEAQRMFAALGGSLLPAGSRIERQFRDLHAMSSHFLLQPDSIDAAYGSLLLGLDLPPGTRL
ncbi:acyl-CoA dehydrogenase family protein [Marinibaculum pumilum]|uniref:Acyl-CoA dehydrogenase family protein n=1 Tax=Marinibaculum pumilum TaxID=1766165 RepID=A0ABV7LA47_9PROT